MKWRKVKVCEVTLMWKRHIRRGKEWGEDSKRRRKRMIRGGGGQAYDERRIWVMIVFFVFLFSVLFSLGNSLRVQMCNPSNVTFIICSEVTFFLGFETLELFHQHSLMTFCNIDERIKNTHCFFFFMSFDVIKLLIDVFFQLSSIFYSSLTH